jgi:hypothetical protein
LFGFAVSPGARLHGFDAESGTQTFEGFVIVERPWRIRTPPSSRILEAQQIRDILDLRAVKDRRFAISENRRSDAIVRRQGHHFGHCATERHFSAVEGHVFVGIKAHFNLP